MLLHVTVTAAGGFGPDEAAALNGLRTLQVDDQAPELRVRAGRPRRPAGLRPLLDESAVWQSATPFVVTRYPKLRGTKRDRPEDYASPGASSCIYFDRNCSRQRSPPIESLELTETIGPHQLRPLQFKRCRRKAGDDGGRRPAAGCRIAFPRMIAGPLVLGQGSHFGLGLFLPA